MAVKITGEIDVRKALRAVGEAVNVRAADAQRLLLKKFASRDAQVFAAAAAGRFAPTKTQERDILTKGRILEPWTAKAGLRARTRTARAFGRRSVGSASGMRFLKVGENNLFIRDALKTQKWRVPQVSAFVGRPTAISGGVQVPAGLDIRVKWGSWKDMARRTGFLYYRHIGGHRPVGPYRTEPFNHDWPRKANYGGTWIVVPGTDLGISSRR